MNDFSALGFFFYPLTPINYKGDENSDLLFGFNQLEIWFLMKGITDCSCKPEILIRCGLRSGFAIETIIKGSTYIEII